MSLRRRLLVEWALILAIATFAVVLLSQWRATAAFDNLFYDRLSSVARPAADRDILIINIDEPSLKALGKWPWPRETHAALIDKLKADQPRSILLDLLLSEAGTSSGDAALAASMRQSGRVYLPVNFPAPGSDGRPHDTEKPAPPFTAAAAGLGHVNITHDDDGTVRRANLCFQSEAGTPRWPHVAELVARQDGAPTLAFRRLRDCNEPLLLPYAMRDSHAEISYSDALTGRIPADLVRGKDILIGASAAGMGDSYAAPFGDGGVISGVEIMANIIGALRRDDFVTPLAPMLTLLLSLAPLWLLMIGFLRWRPRNALAASIVAGLCVVAASAGGLAARVWFPPGAALFGIALVYPLWGWRRLQAMSAFMEHELRDLEREGDAIPLGRNRDRAGDLVGRQSMALAQAIDHLRDLRRFVSDSLEHLPDPMFVTSPDGSVTLASHRIDEYLGTPAQNMKLDDLLELIVSPGQRKTVDTFLSRDASEKASAEDFIRFSAPDGRHFVMRRAQILDDGERLLGHIHYLTDISELARAENDREEALQLLSHDMRAPQSAIIAMLPGLPDAATRMRIERHARRTIQLAQDFVDIARMGETEFEGVDILLGDLVKDVADSLWPLAEERQVRIKVQDETGDGFVNGEPDTLTRAICNLLDNAIKYSPEGGSVIARISRDPANPGVLHLTISDEGGGIDPELLPRLFSRFAASAKDGTRIHSTGLGLNFVAAVAARHGGTISADNGPKGAIFQLVLPEAEEFTPDPPA